jgi:hypothetical protein
VENSIAALAKAVAAIAPLVISIEAGARHSLVRQQLVSPAPPARQQNDSRQIAGIIQFTRLFAYTRFISSM